MNLRVFPNAELRQRDADAHNRILSGVKELSLLLHLPDTLSEALSKVHDRDAFKQMMLQREAMACAIEGIVEGVKSRESLIASHAQLPQDMPGRTALLRAGYTSEAAVANLSEEDLLSIDGIGKGTVERIQESLKLRKESPKTFLLSEAGER